MFKYQRKSHSKYNIKYHFVFCTKYRKRILTGLFVDYIKELMIEKTKSQETIRQYIESQV